MKLQASPAEIIYAIDKVNAEEHLRDFVEQAWPYIDPSPFVPGWHIDEICDHLEAATRREIRHLLINIPPRHMKSSIVCVLWPVWVWIAYPEKQWLFTSYAQTLSMRDSVKCRRLIDSPWFKQRWGDRFQLTSDQNTKMRFDNNHDGFRIASSVDGVATGEGGNFIVVDDAHNVKEASSDVKRQDVLLWWDEAMPTRLNNPAKDSFIVIMQRVHHEDLAGHILAKNDPDWTHLCLPARYEPDHPHLYPGDRRTEPGELLWPERFGEKEMASIEMSLGTYGAAGQLQQRPAPRDGGMFNAEWFEVVDDVPAQAIKVRFWDMAASEVTKKNRDPDWTVGALVYFLAGVYYIANIQRFRKSPHKVEKTVRYTAIEDTTSVRVAMEQEPGSSGKAEISHYQRNVLHGFAFHGRPSTGSKALRAEPFSAAAEAGNVKMKRGPWNRAFLDEVVLFPGRGPHDDQVDAVSGAIAELTGHAAPHYTPLTGF